MKLIIVRHGETEANVKGIYSGWTDYRLTDKGENQAKQATKHLKGEYIDAIYSSPMERTLKTAKNIAREMNKDIKIIDNLKEVNFGMFEGKTHKEISKDYKKEYDDWTADYVNYRISQGESLKDLHDRINDFIYELKMDSKDKTYLLVTHGGVIRVLITIVLGIDIEKMWNFKVPPGALVEIEYNQGFGILTRLIRS